MVKSILHINDLIQVRNITHAYTDVLFRVYLLFSVAEYKNDTPLFIPTTTYDEMKALVGWPEFTKRGTTIKLVINPELVESVKGHTIVFKNKKSIKVAGDHAEIINVINSFEYLGVQGEPGETGAQGIQGIQGEPGEVGAQGIQGIQGEQGETGDQGIQGIQGEQGDPGGVTTSLLNNSGRFYLYTDNRWVTDSDDNYGLSYYQFNENCGTGVDPLIEWEHMGIFIPKGRTIKKLHFTCRANNVQVTDVEIYGLLRHPNPITRWESGMDNDSEDTVIELFRELFVENASPALNGNMADRRRRTFVLDTEVPEDSYLSIYIKPVGTLTANRYLTTSYTWEVE